MALDLLVAGGVRGAHEGGLEVVPLADGFRLRYAAVEQSPGSYPAVIEPVRLSAVLRRSERGWVARAAVLAAVGYGLSREAALDDLRDSIEQYLEFLRDDRPQLAVSVAHHGAFVSLLDVPRDSWFASVSLDASPLE